MGKGVCCKARGWGGTETRCGIKLGLIYFSNGQKSTPFLLIYVHSKRIKGFQEKKVDKTSFVFFVALQNCQILKIWENFGQKHKFFSKCRNAYFFLKVSLFLKI
jgi:hypothetical protein